MTYAAVGSQALRRFGFTVLAAAGAEEEATYNPAFGHSVFTYFLVRGLETGQADANRDGKIRASELYAYVRDEMASFFGGSAQRHRPQLYQGSGDPVLFRLP